MLSACMPSESPKAVGVGHACTKRLPPPEIESSSLLLRTTMVTRTFVRVRTTPSEAAAPSTAVVDSSINASAPSKQILKQSQLHSCKHHSCSERAKHPGDATVAAEEGLCDRHSTHVNKAEGGDKKRALPSEDSISSEEIKRRKRNCHQKSVVIDLSDVPPQQPNQRVKAASKKEHQSILESISVKRQINGMRKSLSKGSNVKLVLMTMKRRLQ